MKIFKDLSASELIGSIACTKDVVEMYEKGLETKNIFLTICAQNELERRGDYYTIQDHISKYIEEGKLELGTEFAHLLSESLLEFRSPWPYLAKLGKQIKIETARKGEGVFSLEEPISVIEEKDLRDIYDVLNRMTDNSMSEEDIKEAVRNFFANKNVLSINKFMDDQEITFVPPQKVAEK